MFEITKSFRFEAGHSLKYHNGRCREPHGHSFVLEVHLKGDKLNDTGPNKNMMFDFIDIGDIVKPMIETYFDHKWLNESLNCDSPTVEFMVKWIYNHLKPSLPYLHSVTLHE